MEYNVGGILSKKVSATWLLIASRGGVTRKARKKQSLINSFDFERQGSTKYRRLVSLETRVIVPIQIVDKTGPDLI